MRRWIPGLAAVGVIALAVLAVQLLPWPPSPRGDFAPFEMTITYWSAARAGPFSDGRTLSGTSVSHLQYKSRENWTITLVSDEVGGSLGMQTPDAYACRNGVYGHMDLSGAFHISRDPYPCPGASRWIGYGTANAVGWPSSWDKHTADSVVTYSSAGERVSFDLISGLPILYEAGLRPDGTAQSRVMFHVDQR